MEDKLWQAVVGRDLRREHEFVYAVQSTGIYCRAGCPSRRPRRDNVRFFTTPDVAEGAGFRPCRRCRPRAGGARAWVQAIRRRLESAEGAPVPLADLARGAGLSPSRLQRRFRQLVGVSPRQYAEALRTARLKQELRRSPRVTDAIYEAGFGSGSRVYERVDDRLGMTPGAYRRGGEGVRLSFTVVPCALGQLLVAESARGLARISLGDDAAALARALHAEYPAADVVRDDRALRARARQVLALLRSDRAAADLPTDVAATAFEWKVWNALRRIPRGETRTYGEIARAIGRPGAARAVGRACGANRLALVIPCHRVVPRSGGHGGYRWGAERKSALLTAESGGKSR